MSEKIEVSALQKALEDLEASAEKLNKAGAVKEMPKKTEEANGGLQEHLEALPEDMQVKASEEKGMSKSEEKDSSDVVKAEALPEKKEEKKEAKEEDDDEEEVVKSFKDIATESNDQFFVIDDWLKVCLDSVAKSNEEVRDALIAKGGLEYNHFTQLAGQFAPLTKAVQAIGDHVLQLSEMMKSLAGEPVAGPKARVAPVHIDRQPTSLWNSSFGTFNKSFSPGVVPNVHQVNNYAPNGGAKIDSGNVLKALVDLAQAGKINGSEVSVYEVMQAEQGSECLSPETKSQLEQYFNGGQNIG